ncbi:MAG: aminotransferase class III-fold pyridoxal phosphate-dependent enzyme [Verrucomicrobia bacterium]|nr:aminotransferase class III-fold pyridoxal phosphate-dependent enzyme [Verrucomicrobiota bacterium]
MTQLAIEALKKDPRVEAGKALLLGALQDAQKNITAISPPDPDKQDLLADLVQKAAAARGAPLWYPYISSGVGNGSLVQLIDGSIKYDYTNGIGVFPGHSLPKLVAASIEAALEDTVMQGNLQQNSLSIALCERLARLGNFDHCFLSSSGAMACENGLKICLQKNFPRCRLLAFERCFMGRTLALSNVTDKDIYREGLPTLIDVDYVPLDEQKALPALEQHLKRYPNHYCAMVMELVQGEGGVYTGSKQLFHEICDFLHAHGILVIIDEVQTFGRTLELFAHHHFELQGKADVVTLGKLSQVCGTLFNKNIAPIPGLLSQTFTSSTSAIYGAWALLDHLEDKKRYGREGLHARLHQHFVKRLQTLPNISGPFGLGLMIGFTPLGGEETMAKELLLRLFHNGLIAFTAGAHPTRIRCLPPLLTTSEEEIDAVIDILAHSLKEMALC